MDRYKKNRLLCGYLWGGHLLDCFRYLTKQPYSFLTSNRLATAAGVVLNCRCQMRFIDMSWGPVIHKPPALIYSVSGWLTSDSITRSDQISYTNEHDFLCRLRLHENSCTVKLNFLVGWNSHDTEVLFNLHWITQNSHVLLFLSLLKN